MIKRNIPNALTCLNLSGGVLALYFVLHLQEPVLAVYCILASGIFDFFDGFVARWLNVKSAIGKDLDSLADMVSFGVVPAAFAWHILTRHPGQIINSQNYGLLIVLLIPVASALRLAKFNHDDSQSVNFKGIPTPSNAIFWLGMFYLSKEIVFSNLIIYILLISMSLLLLIPFEVLSLKPDGKDLNTSNKFKISFVLIALSLLILFQLKALAMIIILQIILSLIHNNISKNESLPTR